MKPTFYCSLLHVYVMSVNMCLIWATLKAGMTERQNGGITERRKITPNPKRWNRGMAERRKITQNPKRRRSGTDFGALSVIPSFRISGYFPSFRLLGFRALSVIPSFRISEYFPSFHRSAIPSLGIWGDFPSFRHSVF